MGIFNIRFPFQCRKEAIIETNKILKKFKYPLDEVRSIDETMTRSRKMGVSIDESINGVEKRILPIYDNDADHEALVVAIDYMQKYKKIEQIYDNWDADYGIPTYTAMCKIGEVLKDGKND